MSHSSKSIVSRHSVVGKLQSPNGFWTKAIIATSLAALVMVVVIERPYVAGMILAGIFFVVLFAALFTALNGAQLLSLWAFLLPFSIKVPSEILPITSTYIILYLIVLRQLLTHPRLRISSSATSRIQMRMILMLFTVGILAAVVGIDPGNSIRKLYNTFNFVLVYIATVQIVKYRDDVRLIARALIVAGVLLAAIGLAQVGGAFLLGGGISGASAIVAMNRVIVVLTEGPAVLNRVSDWSTWWRYNNWYSTAFNSLRATGTSWSPMGFAQMLYLSYFPVMMLTLTWPKRRGRALLTLIMVVQTTALIATLSRGAWLGIAVGTAVVGIHFVRGRICITKTAIRRLTLIGIVATAIVLTIMPGETRYAMIAAFQSAFRPEVGISGFDSSNQARFSSYQTGLDMIAANPLSGVGPGNFSVASGAGEGATSHNLYLDIAAELGIIGLLVFFVILILSLANFAFAARISKDWYLRALSVGWSAALVSLMFYWMFTSYFFEPKLNMMLWLVLGLSASLRRIASTEFRIRKERAV